MVVYKDMTQGVIQEAERVVTGPERREGTRHCRMVGPEAEGGDLAQVEQLLQGFNSRRH